MRIVATSPDFHALANNLLDELKGDVGAAILLTTEIAKREVRDQTVSSGLGTRLAQTWRSNVYGVREHSLNPAGHIFSRAPAIADAFSRGATIIPARGGKYLWIPTRAVPRRRGRGRATSTKAMTPEEVEAEFNQRFIIKPGRMGRMMAFIVRGRGTTKTGRIRNVRKGRLGRGPRDELVLMFNLVRATRLPKKLDLQGVADRWARNFDRAMQSEGTAR